MFWTIVIIVFVVWCVIDANSGSSHSKKHNNGGKFASQRKSETSALNNTADSEKERIERAARLASRRRELEKTTSNTAPKNNVTETRVTKKTSRPNEVSKSKISDAQSPSRGKLSLKKSFGPEQQSGKVLSENFVNEEDSSKPNSKTPVIKDLEDWGIKSLWHMTHVRNVPGIMKSGLLCHRFTINSKLAFSDISDPDVQRWRTKEDPFYRRSLHDYVPFYINPKNPMLYRRKEMQSEICFLEVSLDAVEGQDFLLTNGNAASSKTEFYDGCWGLQFLPWEVLRAAFWTDFEDGKRKACSEVLLPDRVDAGLIRTVHCFSRSQAEDFCRNGINAKTSVDKYFR